jgi:hypothetical protein
MQGAFSFNKECNFGSGYPLQVLTSLRYVPGFPLLSGSHGTIEHCSTLSTIYDTIPAVILKI